MEDIRTSARVIVHTLSTSVRSRSFIARKGVLLVLYLLTNFIGQFGRLDELDLSTKFDKYSDLFING